MTEQFYVDNHANWDDRAAVHVGSEMHRIDDYANDPSVISGLVEFDLTQMGAVDGLSVAHLHVTSAPTRCRSNG
jgi:hypothetical protein